MMQFLKSMSNDSNFSNIFTSFSLVNNWLPQIRHGVTIISTQLNLYENYLWE